MSVKWTGNHNETGILRKSESSREKKEELFVFGYSCKLFRDDEKALHIDQGKHLIPWMGDETLKIDRYDARGALHELVTLEAPPGGFDWRVELSKTEQDVEQLCDEERYRALHTDEDEEEMYKEEELKRLHAAGYGQVGFNYDTPVEIVAEVPAEVEEPFEPTLAFKELLPLNTELPETQKQNAIIEKTANFIAHQGAQMEILIKAKQGDNPQFKFLNKDSPLHGYYTALIALVKAGKWPEKPEVMEEKQDISEEYLHPSLASTIIEAAPSIPSIHYKPSADCDYTLLISKMRGETLEEYSDLAPGEVAPPGTEPVLPRADIMKAPVMYNRGEPVPTTPAITSQEYTVYYNQYMAQLVQTNSQPPVVKKPVTPITPTKSTGLSLMKNYNTDSESEESDFDDSSSTESKDNIVLPPDDIQVVIDKMAAYVARNGDEFEEIVRAKNDPRFTFLEINNVYHPFYKRLMQQKRGGVNGNKKKHDKIPVSFSIKKHKEPDPILPKPALPYESSSDGEEDASEKPEEPKELLKTNIPQIHTTNNLPPILVYKMESVQDNNLPLVTTFEPTNITKAMTEVFEIPKESMTPQIEEKFLENVTLTKVEDKVEPTPDKKELERVKEREKSPRDKRKHRDRKKDYRSKSERDSRRSGRRSVDREKEREKKRDRVSERDRRRKKYKEVMESEIISLEDNSDEMIDLTGELSDSKGEDPQSSRGKQQQRRRRAAEFLRRVSRPAPSPRPAPAALPHSSLPHSSLPHSSLPHSSLPHSSLPHSSLPHSSLPHSSLASAMVDTLESLYKKKSEEDEKKKRREKRRRRDKRDYEEEDRHRRSKRKKNRSSEEEDSDFAGSKKRKRKKEKKHSTKDQKKRRSITELEEESQPLNNDLSNTLKELRNSSPTKELRLDESKIVSQENSDEKDKKRTKKEREYSEGEWSSDSEEAEVITAK